MKHLNLLFLLLILSSGTAYTQSINHNQVLNDLIFSQKWFEVENYYQQHKDSIDDITTRWYLARIGGVFNRPVEAIDAYEQIIDNTPNINLEIVLPPLIQFCVNFQEYAKGEEFCKKIITLLENNSIVESKDKRRSDIHGLKQVIESFKHLSKTYPKPTIIKNEVKSTEGIKLIPNELNNGIFFNAMWNGIQLKTHFDTGASAGAYIWNREIAEKIGVKLNTTDTVMANGTIHCLIGIIDSLELGEFSIKNIPAFVNIESIGRSDSSQVICDSISHSMLDIILGMPIIRQLGVIKFDFVNKTMLFSQSTIPIYKRNLYISESLKTLFLNMEICNANFLTRFDTGGNGLGLSISTDFYDKYKECISLDGQAIQESVSFGSCDEANTPSRYRYNCPQIDVKVNDQVIKMINNCSVAKDKENDFKFDATGGGYLGNDIFKYCKTATFDFDNMVFNVEK